MAGMTLLCAGTAALLVLSFLSIWVQKKRMRALTERIERFLSNETEPLPFSVKEDAFAGLENSVSDLTNRLVYLKARAATDQQDMNRLLLDISHQLKTPLASLRLFCEMDAAKHQQQELCQIDHMEKLIYALLRLERLCAGGYRFHFDAADTRAMAEEALHALRPLYPHKRFTVTGTAALHCDQHWLTEAIHNLLKNACEHTKDDGHVAFKTECTDNAVFLTVQDDGGGVDREDLPHLFERFYRSKNAAGEGTGIGLAMVREIVRRHHGSLTCENHGGGLKIVICIPLYEKQLIDR